MSEQTNPSDDLTVALHALGEARATLREIQMCLSGKEWGADTPLAIAEVLTRNGYEIKEPPR